MTDHEIRLPCVGSIKIQQEELRLISFCFIFTFVWGLLAHGYGFLHSSYSHDVLNALYAGSVENYWKQQLGRFFVVYYRQLLRGPLALPWLCGVIALIWTSLSVYLTAKLFSINKPVFVLLLAGLYTVNVTFISMTATYIYELDADMFALLLACAACVLWRCGRPLALVIAAGLVCGTLGMYQSYVSVTITLIIIVCILDLMQGRSFVSVIISGLKGILVLAVGAALYYACFTVISRMYDFSMEAGSYNSMDAAFSGMLLSKLQNVYASFFAAFFDGSKAHLTLTVRVLNFAVFIMLGVSVVLFLVKKGISVISKLLVLVLLVLFPLGANFVCLLTGGMLHTLMMFAFVLVSVFLLLIVFDAGGHLASSRFLRPVAAIAAVLLIWNNVLLANSSYLKKELEASAALSYMTRVSYMLESRDDYIPGETEIAFVGVSDLINNVIPGFDICTDLTGLDANCAIPTSNAERYYNAYQAYFTYILNTPVAMCDSRTWNLINTSPEAAAMPCYPDNGCVAEIDGVLAVKLGSTIW